jgi:hypothetical protein
MRIQDLTELTSLADTDLVVVDDYQSSGVYNTKKITVANLKSELGLPSTYLYGFITQTGTDAPTLTILKNTLGITPTTSYNNVGDYTIDFASATLNSSTIVTLGTSGIYPYTLQASYSNSTTIALKSFRDNVKYDNVFVNIPIKIEIYG